MANKTVFTINEDASFNGVLYASTLNNGTNLTLPTTDGTADQILKTDGNGALSWGDSSAVGTLSLTTSTDLTLPSTDGTADQILKTDGNGALSWGDSSAVGTLSDLSDVFEQINSPGWYKQGGDIDGEAASDESGYSVSLNGDGTIVAIGAYANDGNGDRSGHVRVYQKDETTTLGWTQLGDDIDGESSADNSGWSVSLSSNGNIVAIGAYANDGNGASSGHVRVYQRDVSNTTVAPIGWTQLGDDIDGDMSAMSWGTIYGERSGYSISLSNNGLTVAIGGIRWSSEAAGLSRVGRMRVFQYSNNTWTQLGGDIEGEASYDQSGYSVSLSSNGNIVAIGAKYNDGVNGSYSGHVRVYERDVSNTTVAPIGWTQVGDDIDGEAAIDESGYSVSLSSNGNIVAIGSPFNDGNGASSGHVRVYQRDVSNTTVAPIGWTQLGDDIDGEAENDQSGYSVSLSDDGTIVAIGAYANDGVNGSNSGHVRVYQRDVSNTTVAPIGWTQLGDIDGEAASDESGRSVSLSADGTIVAIGSPFNDGVNGSNSGHVRVYKYYTKNDLVLGNVENIKQVFLGKDKSISLDCNSVNCENVNCSKIVYTSTLNNGTNITLPSIDGTANQVLMTDGEGTLSWNVGLNKSWIGQFTQLGDDIDGEATNDQSGYSVSLSNDGNIIAIGARDNNGVNGIYSGHVRVYERDVSNTTVAPIGWTQLGDDIDGEAATDFSGGSVSLSSNGLTVAIGAKYNNGVNGTYSGHVRVYQRDVSNTTVAPIGWTQVGDDIDGEAANDQSGYSVSLSDDGTIVAISAYYNDGIKGHVRVYQRDVSNTTVAPIGWTQLGDDIDGEAENDQSGYSISLSSNGLTVAIGAKNNDGVNGTDSGHVRVYQFTDTNGDGLNEWFQLGDDIDGEATNDQSGYSVSLSADGYTVAIGALYNDGNGINSGHVRVYQYSNNAWSQLGDDIDGDMTIAHYDPTSTMGEQSGMSVSLSNDGTIVAIGARIWSTSAVKYLNGRTRVYQYSNNAWSQFGDDIEGEAANDESGYSVSLSGDGSTVAIGAPYNDGFKGHVRVYQLDTGKKIVSLCDNDTTNVYVNKDNSANVHCGSVILGASAPSSSNATGTAGEIRVVDDYIYICKATDSWVRVQVTDSSW